MYPAVNVSLSAMTLVMNEWISDREYCLCALALAQEVGAVRELDSRGKAFEAAFKSKAGDSERYAGA